MNSISVTEEKLRAAVLWKDISHGLLPPVFHPAFISDQILLVLVGHALVIL